MNLKSNRGFTLIELIIVLLLIAILTIYVLSRTTTTPSLQGAVDGFKAQLRYAQHTALCGNASMYTWSMTIGQSSYYFTQTNTVASTSINVLLPGGDTTNSFPSGITSTWVGKITFDQWGSPGSSSIVIPLTDGVTTTNVTITKNTGFVT